MLHLFNKVYLEFDEKIDINYDRVIISDQYGVQMYQALDKVAQGELLAYGKTYEEVVIGDDIIGFITSLKDFSKTTGLDRKIVVYCDKLAFKKFIAIWYKTIMPELDEEGFAQIVKHIIYNQRAVSNTQLSSSHSVSLQTIWDSFDDINDYWNEAPALSEEDKVTFDAIGIKLSYEYLVADYLSGSENYKEELRSTMHMFMRRWFKEIFTDNRQMVLLNLPSHSFQTAFDIDPEMVDVTRVDPLAGIAGFEYYADDEIWERSEEFATGIFGVCNLQGLSEEQVTGLKNTLLNVYSKFEGMQIDRSMFEVLDWAKIAARDTITDAELDTILDYVVNKPFDTNLIPRFDFQNVNFPLFLYFLSQKHKGADLSKFRLV